MASLFGPEFIVNLLVLLVIMVVVILLFDRLLRRRGGVSLLEQKGRRQTCEWCGRRYCWGEEGERWISRLSAIISAAEGQQAQSRRDLRTAVQEANDALNQEPGSPATKALMKRIDDQFLRTLSYFVDSQDRSSSLHMEHNYLWQVPGEAQEAPNEAFTALTQSWPS